VNLKMLSVIEAINLVLLREHSNHDSSSIVCPKATLLSDIPTKGLVEQLLPTLKARLQNADREGKVIFGLAMLVDSLSKLRPDEVLLGYSFAAPDLIGVAYANNSSNDIVGVTFVNL
jgi:hypothetical protein